MDLAICVLADLATNWGLLTEQKGMTGEKAVWTSLLRTQPQHRWAVDEETTS